MRPTSNTCRCAGARAQRPDHQLCRRHASSDPVSPCNGASSGSAARRSPRATEPEAERPSGTRRDVARTPLLHQRPWYRETRSRRPECSTATAPQLWLGSPDSRRTLDLVRAISSIRRSRCALPITTRARAPRRPASQQAPQAGLPAAPRRGARCCQPLAVAVRPHARLVPSDCSRCVQLWLQQRRPGGAQPLQQLCAQLPPCAESIGGGGAGRPSRHRRACRRVAAPPAAVWARRARLNGLHRVTQRRAAAALGSRALRLRGPAGRSAAPRHEQQRAGRPRRRRRPGHGRRRARRCGRRPGRRPARVCVLQRLQEAGCADCQAHQAHVDQHVWRRLDSRPVRPAPPRGNGSRHATWARLPLARTPPHTHRTPQQGL